MVTGAQSLSPAISMAPSPGPAGSSRLRTSKRICRKLGIEEHRLGLAAEEGKLLEIPEAHG